MSNLQFLCENERVHKFANGFCSPAFMLQEYKQQMKDSFMQQDGNQASILYLTNEDNANSSLMEPSIPLIDKASCIQLWNDCIVKLSKVLCLFLLAPEDVKSHHEQISSIYGELSIKWVIKVLLVVFPSIKTCPYKNELPRHLW